MAMMSALVALQAFMVSERALRTRVPADLLPPSALTASARAPSSLRRMALTWSSIVAGFKIASLIAWGPIPCHELGLAVKDGRFQEAQMEHESGVWESYSQHVITLGNTSAPEEVRMETETMTTHEFSVRARKYSGGWFCLKHENRTYVAVELAVWREWCPDGGVLACTADVYGPLYDRAVALGWRIVRTAQFLEGLNNQIDKNGPKPYANDIVRVRAGIDASFRPGQLVSGDDLYTEDQVDNFRNSLLEFDDWFCTPFVALVAVHNETWRHWGNEGHEPYPKSAPARFVELAKRKDYFLVTEQRFLDSACSYIGTVPVGWRELKQEIQADFPGFMKTAGPAKVTVDEVIQMAEQSQPKKARLITVDDLARVGRLLVPGTKHELQKQLRPAGTPVPYCHETGPDEFRFGCRPSEPEVVVASHYNGNSIIVVPLWNAMAYRGIEEHRELTYWAVPESWAEGRLAVSF